MTKLRFVSVLLIAVFAAYLVATAEIVLLGMSDGGGF
jgi:hypothetical protein